MLWTNGCHDHRARCLSNTGIRSPLTSYTRVVPARRAASRRLSTVSTAVNTMTDISLMKSRSITETATGAGQGGPARITRPGTSMETPMPTRRERQ